MSFDPILFWNDVAIEANRIDFTVGGANGKPEQGGPTLSSRALAIIHLAMYDAYAGVKQDPTNLPPYLTAPFAGANDEDTAALAVAGAAYTTLTNLYSNQKPKFDSLIGLIDTTNSAYQFGVNAGNGILSLRNSDPDASDAGYTPSDARGKHREDPDNFPQGFHAPFYGANSNLFACTARHQLAPPPALNSNDYKKALKQVREKGIAHELMGTLPSNASKRTYDETVIGIYWGYDGAKGLGTPPRLYNQIVREIAKARNNSIADNARLFAFVNVAMGDAGILAWEQKYIHDLWRPVLGVREHDVSMGPSDSNPPKNDLDDNCDTNWLPLGAPSTNTTNKNFTPPFPAYPSGHATFGAAAFHITRLFYGITGYKKDSLFNGLFFVSDELNGKNKDNKGTIRPEHKRSFSTSEGGLWKMIEENGSSRVFLGVHWEFDAFEKGNNSKVDLGIDFAIKNNKVDSKNSRGGVPLGLQIAEDIFSAGNGKAPKKP